MYLLRCSESVCVCVCVCVCACACVCVRVCLLHLYTPGARYTEVTNLRSRVSTQDREIQLKRVSGTCAVLAGIVSDHYIAACKLHWYGSMTVPCVLDAEL